MSVDISHIIRHDFHEVNNRDLAISYLKRTIERLNYYFMINNAEECYIDDEELYFCYTPLKMDFYLHDGFWQIESYYPFSQIIMHLKGDLGLRKITYRIAKALGQEEAWYATDYLTWNGYGCDVPDVSFEHWMQFVCEKYGKPIPEFDISVFQAQGDVHIPDYEPIYHDSFKDLS